jgi:nucleotidyltransferase substrate binding protein (TIGR01987 family)
MSDLDVRWKQRLQNFTLALTELSEAVTLSKSRPLTKLENQGLVQGFEITHELAWNVLKDYFLFQGNANINGSRDAAREAFNKGLIKNGEAWMEMIQSRNQSSHTYNKKTADEIVEKILKQYYQEFVSLRAKMESLRA